MEKSVKVIDIFAGPGGLGEGFFSYEDDNGNFPFDGLMFTYFKFYFIYNFLINDDKINILNPNWLFAL